MRSPVFYFVFFAILLLPSTATSSELKTYIVHVRRPPAEHDGSHQEWHESFLPHPSRLIYSYDHILYAFAARLSEEELDALRSARGFIHAAPETFLSLHTTHSPAFLGLNPGPSGFWSSAGYGKGVIIGVLDTGVEPSHPSFNGRGMPPPPVKWKGKCQLAGAYRCNNKLIGAVSFARSNGSSSTQPIDTNGHGTHTASTAAGSFVANASVLGSAAGTAAGVAPYSHVAAYKVCGGKKCSDADVIAGMDQAVKDGVDVLSISLGERPTKLFSDSIAIATFGAVTKGVFVSASAGNDGPTPSSVGNVAPWILTVGASSINRKIRAVVKLGNGEAIDGESAYQPRGFTSSQLAVVSTEGNPSAAFCSDQLALERLHVKGKIVLCDEGVIENTDKGTIVKNAGGAAMILLGASVRGYETMSEAHVIPTSHVNYADGLRIRRYVNSTRSPTATIFFEGTAIGGRSAPEVAAFSSRGPNRISPGILKPDIVGPGLNVLAAWPSPVGAFPVRPFFNIISGTSMSCPHLSGVAALLKSLHPKWSPAMIKSAIVTTAYTENLGGGRITDLSSNDYASFYDTGAGHVDPARAANPGLVYDVGIPDYVAYLCGLGYTEKQVRVIAGDIMTDCSRRIHDSDLNYPSFAISLAAAGVNAIRVVRRNVTNVGPAGSCYEINVRRPPGIVVRVQPQRLAFAVVGQTATFSVSFGVNSSEAAGKPARWVAEGFLSWVSSDGRTEARSPITVTVGDAVPSPSAVEEPYKVSIWN